MVYSCQQAHNMYVANKQAHANFISTKRGGYILNYSTDTMRTHYTTWYYDKS
jgi:hypothetical protein